MARKCPVCRSKEWHKQPASGLLVCGEGHILQDYRNETSERTDFGHRMRQRHTRKIREKRSGVQEDEIVYYGPQARYLYFEALQLILRTQISFLIKEWNLPTDFELICRDIWSLHLNLLRRPPQPEPHLVRLDGVDTQDGVGHDAGQADKGPNSSSGSDEDLDTKVQESELTNLLRDMSEFETSDDENPDDFIGIKRPERRKFHNRDEIPAGNIAVLMLACWLLRVPVMYVDFIRLIEAYKLPYLEAVRLLPEGLTRYLTQATKNNLSPSNPPSVSGLHEVTSRLGKHVWTRNGVHVAEMNTSWLLWRMVKRMGGDSTIYKMVKMMAVELNLPLTLNPRLAPELIRKRSTNGRRMRSDNLPVEVSLMAAVILVLKLKCDFAKHASDETERGRILVAESEDTVFLNCGKELAMSELNDEEMDGYLDFCELALLPQRKEDKTVAEFFPKPRMVENQNSSKRTSPELATICMTDRDVAGRISIFHFADSGGTLPEPFLAVLGVAARFIGVGLEELGSVVERFERRLVRFRSRDPENRSFA